MSELVTIQHIETNPYMLLSPGSHLPRTGPEYQRICSQHDLQSVLDSAWDSEYVAVDFETNGSDFSLPIPQFHIAGIGLAWDTGSAYFHWADLDSKHQLLLMDFLLDHPRLLAHNVGFDGGVVYRYTGIHSHWYMCTYSLLSMLANEGYPGQGWGLKAAQTSLLGWADSNEHELNEWLVVNGHYRGSPRKDNSPEYLREEYLSGGLRPDKSKMHLAPRHILGKYCVLDAEACYLLFTQVLYPVCRKFPALDEFLRKEFMHLILILIEQKMAGILMDREGLLQRRQTLESEIAEISTLFRNHPQTRDHIRNMENESVNKKFHTVPTQFKKDGEISKVFTNWMNRRDIAMRGEDEECIFNINSGPQLRELLYSRLGMKVRILTENGAPAVGNKAYKYMGELGRLLSDRIDRVKELSFIDKYLELTESRPTIHPSFRTPGTLTGRLSSKEPNMQQIPKTRAVMSLFTARSGHVWVDLDFSALEPVVTTEFSRDPNMLTIYGDGVPPNDIYLFVGAQLPGQIGSRIRATGYDPFNSTKESLARAKKECKHERSICKIVVLASQYGAGVKKVMQILEEQDIHLDYEEVSQIHSGYWEVFARVKDFARSLHFEWKRNKGYILNGLGRPMAVPPDMDKDLLNRFVQSTGHDILVRYVRLLTENLVAARIPWTPVIIDFHDATTVEVPEEYANKVVGIFNESMNQLNKELGGSITLRGTPTVGRNLADVKEPEQ